MPCPYCSSDESCEHHLLTVDLDEQEALGGALYELFTAKWKAVRPTPDERDEDSYRERVSEAFYRCLGEVEEFSTQSEVETLDTVGGMGESNQQHLYCSTYAQVLAAVRQYRGLQEPGSN